MKPASHQPPATTAKAFPFPSQPLAPGGTIGILGGGQLGRMLATAALELGFRTAVFCPAGEAPAADIAHETVRAPYEDTEALERFITQCDRVTYEFENVPCETAAHIAAKLPLAPAGLALDVAQDRLREKQFVESLGFSVAPFAAVNNADELRTAIASVGPDAILKSRRFGYDGKGQIRISGAPDCEAVWSQTGNVPSVLEALIAFESEFSVILARAGDGAIITYPLSENDHAGGILRTARAPAKLPDKTRDQAIDITTAIAESLDYVGVLAVEFFHTGADTPPLINEFAPRVHNSGHWTMDACDHSQFENHIRAVASWPLAAPTLIAPVVMENLIGDDVRHWREHASKPGVHIHIYGKAEARSGRKMGHINRVLPPKQPTA